MTRIVKLDAVRRAVASTPWAILPEKGAAMLELLELRASGHRLTPEEIAERIGPPTAAFDARREAVQAATRSASPGGGAIAVLPLYGLVMHRAAMLNDVSAPRGTSTEKFGQQFDAAVNDPAVSAIVIDIDSPGGSIAGVPELAKKILDARGTKPVVAVCNALMASAAYWIGSAADEIAVTPSGEVGSIGVFCIHEDWSEAAADAGVKFTIVKAGKYKAEGNPWEPLSDEAKAALQASVDDAYDMFVKAVAKARGVSVSDVRSGYGEGRVLGAKQAVAENLADRVATLDDVIADLAKGKRSAKTSARASDTALVIAAADARSDGLHVTQMAGLVAGPSSNPTTRTVAGGAAPDVRLIPVQAHSSQQTPRKGKESPVDEDLVTAPQTGASNGNAAQAAVLAERERSKQIRALCAAHQIDATTADSYIDANLSVEQAKGRILDVKQARHAASPSITGVTDRAAEQKFANFGEQLLAIVEAGKPGGVRDPRLAHVNAQALRMAGTPSGMNESVGSEGGFFIATELLPGVIEPVYTEDPILSRVFRIPSDKPSVKYQVVDETSRVTGSRWGGIQMYRVSEADTATQKKPKTRLFELNKKKIMGIGYLTEELQQDAPAANTLLTNAFQAELAFMLGDEIFRGTGSGQMQGILNSGALVSQAIEGTQTIANSPTFLATNTAKMLSRVPASLQKNAIWLYNQELLPYLVVSVTGTGGSAVPVFIGQGGMAAQPYDTIWGRPAFPSELCEAVGTPGDLLLVVPSEYHMLADGGAQQSTSLHVRFLYDESVLKITYRCDGAPIWRTSVTPYKGSNPRSPFVALATRA
jgi:HK97 family phage major capsid protein